MVKKEAKSYFDNNRYLTDTQYHEALARLLSIVKNEDLCAIEDVTPGNSSISCNWGLCSKSFTLWPTPELHLFPDRPSPKYRQRHHRCPLDPQQKATIEHGCYYRCLVFKSKKVPTREEALNRTTGIINGTSNNISD